MESLVDITKNRRSMGNIFDSEDREISVGTMEDLLEDPDNTYAYHNNRESWWGYVWFGDGKWHEQVKEQGEIIGEYSADSPEELLKMVCDVHGWK
jgi:hypothetical protein